MRKYNIIYADPPWTYRDKAHAGKRGVEYKYPVMSMEDIINLPIQGISADNCVLFLWVTFPKINEIFEQGLFQKWGFEYKTCAFNWVKYNKIKKTPFMGMGRWTRSNGEVCLLGTRGKPRRESAGVMQVIETHDLLAPREEHSKKPDIVRDKIVELCGDIPRIELFAREKVDGWDAIGFDIDGRDIREVLAW